MAKFMEPLMKKIGIRGSDDSPPAESAVSSTSEANPDDSLLSLTHVWADAPNAVKLKINRMLLPLGEARTYDAPEQAAEAPLAAALFAVEGVIQVQLESAMITVHMEEEGDWDTIIEKLPPAVTAHYESGQPAVIGATPEKAAKKYAFGFRQVSSRPKEEQIQIVQELLETEINPAVASHGGHFTLIDVKDDNVYVELGGGCQGCGMADVTLRQGVEQRMKEVLPEMVALIDTTDHASGNNPYYTPGK